ncbi:unnamed protein product [Meloidogyne enterolobii]|uniref:Uncharacterized protein n=1 Tax=Meloidogyne enterolobii TaxID=390850 RepID=A0ACB1AS10_MELEN
MIINSQTNNNFIFNKEVVKELLKIYSKIQKFRLLRMYEIQRRNPKQITMAKLSIRNILVLSILIRRILLKKAEKCFLILLLFLFTAQNEASSNRVVPIN